MEYVKVLPVPVLALQLFMSVEVSATLLASINSDGLVSFLLQLKKMEQNKKTIVVVREERRGVKTGLF